MPKTIIASMMICGAPRSVRGRSILSASDAVWEPVPNIMPNLTSFLTNEIGCRSVSYAGGLQMTNPKVLDLLDQCGSFACFRGVEEQFLNLLDVMNKPSIYETIMDRLELVGWDLCSGNGWLSASSHGVFPINPFDGMELDENAGKINEFGLFADVVDCRVYCEVNDMETPEHSPWYPVAVYIVESALPRLQTNTNEDY